MHHAKEIFIYPVADKGYILICVLAGHGRAYWQATKDFPNATDVLMCLDCGTGLTEGGIDELLVQVRLKLATEYTVPDELKHWLSKQ